ncbi:hypothetical protein FA15DRAFT_758201 [Coprinopsis marcescibilis]|uniref:DUF6535 domain-containing protein n=1 Tax=Coprinopsis marcescibilis TaxID=230819 RepID=A0A5C3KPD8_COPMA|nr:hypothetical protein FA15DRAFT_758201 [Coprinopsis marcescibilis]
MEHETSSEGPGVPQPTTENDGRRFSSHGTDPLQQSTAEQPWKSGDPLRYPLPSDGDPWEKTLSIVDDYDERMCSAWKEEIQSLLIFAGLFSSVVTGFTVESIKLLREDSQDRSADILSRISLQLEAISSNRSSIEPALQQSVFVAPQTVVDINILWSLSLTASLGTVLFGILCLQWLREYQRRDPTVTRETALAVRHMRFVALLKWKIPVIISFLPILLQIGLVLFLVGLAQYLWLMNHSVAYPLFAFVGIIILGLLITTVLPAFSHFFLISSSRQSFAPLCPFKSPQSLIFLQIFYNTAALINRSLVFVTQLPRYTPIRSFWLHTIQDLSFHVTSWSDLDNWWQYRSYEDHINALVWIVKTYGPRSQGIIEDLVYRCISQSSLSHKHKAYRLLDPLQRLKSSDFSSPSLNIYIGKPVLYDALDLGLIFHLGKFKNHYRDLYFIHHCELAIRFLVSIQEDPRSLVQVLKVMQLDGDKAWPYKLLPFIHQWYPHLHKRLSEDHIHDGQRLQAQFLAAATALVEQLSSSSHFPEELRLGILEVLQELITVILGNIILFTKPKLSPPPGPEPPLPSATSTGDQSQSHNNQVLSNGDSSSTPSDAAAIALLNLGFNTLHSNVHTLHHLGSRRSSMPFHVVIHAWISKENTDRFQASKHLLPQSHAFLQYLDLVWDELGSHLSPNMQKEFVQACGIEDWLWDRQRSADGLGQTALHGNEASGGDG